MPVAKKLEVDAAAGGNSHHVLLATIMGIQQSGGPSMNCHVISDHPDIDLLLLPERQRLLPRRDWKRTVLNKTQRFNEDTSHGQETCKIGSER